MDGTSTAATASMQTAYSGIFDYYSVAKVVISAVMIACTIITAVITLVVLKRCKENDDDDRSIRLFQFNAVSNMMAGLSISTVFLMSDPAGNATYSAVTCQIGKTMIYIFNFQSTAFVTAITVNRFLHVKWPLQYHRKVSFKRMNVVITMIWVVSTVYCVYLPLPNFPYVEGLKADCFSSPYVRTSQRLLTTFLIILWSINHLFILFINVLLLKITFEVRRSKRVAAVITDTSKTAEPQRTTSKNVSPKVYRAASRGTNRITKHVQHRGIILVISISVIYFVSCLPGLVMLSFIAAQTIFLSAYVYLGVFLLGIASSVWNILAFIIFDTKFRRVFCGMFKRTREQLV